MIQENPHIYMEHSVDLHLHQKAKTRKQNMVLEICRIFVRLINRFSNKPIEILRICKRFLINFYLLLEINESQFLYF